MTEQPPRAPNRGPGRVPNRVPGRTLRRVLVVLGVLIVVPVVAAVTLLVAVRPPVHDFAPEPWTPGLGFDIDPTVSAPVQAVAATDELFGPEDIAIDSSGNLYTGDREGTVWRTTPGGETTEFADVGGRPLGMMFGPDGSLLIANHGKGLQSVGPDGSVTVLAHGADGEPILFANDLDISADGMVYLNDSSARYNTSTIGDAAPSYLLPDFVDGRAAGRVITYDLASGQTSVLLDSLYFPNGVALTEDGTRLWIAESNRYRILEHTIDSPDSRRVLVDDLPGTPDNINRDADGTMLLALYDRVAVLDTLILPSTLARELMIRLPGDLFVNEENPLTGSILVFDDTGRFITQHTGLDPAATAVVPAGDRWYLGVLLGQPIRWIDRQ